MTKEEQKKLLMELDKRISAQLAYLAEAQARKAEAEAEIIERQAKVTELTAEYIRLVPLELFE